MRRREHSWRLIRCSGCRHLVINSAPRCPNCGAWRPSARAISFALPAVATVTALAVLVLAAKAWIKIERDQAEQRELLTLRTLPH